MLDYIATLFTPLKQFFTSLDLAVITRLTFLFIVGIPATFLVARWLQKVAYVSLSKQQAMLVRRVTIALGIFLILITSFHELGFSLTPLLGAAGILSVALGFASQTSVSNIISGLFLMGEQPFTVGDVIKISDITGEILSIDLLSIKLRTLDNKFIRIPNEAIIKSQVINITRFPIRRVDITLSVGYREDLSRIRELLFKITYDNQLALAEPEPVMVIAGLGDSGINLTLMVWGKKQDFMNLKNQLYERIKNQFQNSNIEIPFPQRHLHLNLDPQTILAKQSC